MEKTCLPRGVELSELEELQTGLPMEEAEVGREDFEACRKRVCLWHRETAGVFIAAESTSSQRKMGVGWHPGAGLCIPPAESPGHTPIRLA